MRAAAFLLLFLPTAFALGIVSPVSFGLENGTQIAIGDVGPGQTFVIAVDPRVSSGGKYGLGGAYDRLFASSLPSGWSSNPSRLYGSPLQADITVPKDAKDGEYVVEMSLWDEAGKEGLGEENLTFFVKAKVSKDVMDAKVEPSSLSVGAGQPARFSITVLNKGIANDIFTIGSKGVRNWEFRRSIYIPAGTSKSLAYEIAGEEEADYKVKIYAKSSSSDEIYSEQEVSLRVNTDLLSDYRAATKGLLLFPLPQAPIYFFAGILSNILPQP